VAAGVANLFLLLDAFSTPKVAAEFRAKQQSGTIRYSELKETLANDICVGLEDFQKKFLHLRSRPRAMLTTLRNGSKNAEKIALHTMKKVRQAIGLPSR
jgi:tryptophanyl-tRNA synthetase